MSNTTIPNKLLLTCRISGKQVTWTNKAIIAKKIEQFGSLEAFVAQFTCKGAHGKTKPTGKSWKGVPLTPKEVINNPGVLKPVFEQGVELGKMSEAEYKASRVTRVYENKDGTKCTVTAPRTSGDDAAGR